MASDNALENALANRAWIQWAMLGVDAVTESDNAVVDPEALIALTAELGDTDARLRDVSSDWCVSYGRYVNGARLRRVVHEMATPPLAIGVYVATISAAGGPQWPMATQPRLGYQPRGKARLDTAESPARLRIRLRAAFGVNARADVIAALLGAPASGLNISELARQTRFSKQNVAFVVDALTVANLVTASTTSNERRVSLRRDVNVLLGLKRPLPQPDWVARFGLALRVLRFIRRDEGSMAVRAIEARRLIESQLDLIRAEGAPEPPLGALGEAFSTAFDRWVVELVDWLRRPTGFR